MLQRAILTWTVALVLTLAAQSQSCPRENQNGLNIESGSVILTGTVVYHNEIRQWLELHLAEPVCGNTSVQLLDEVGGAFEVDAGGMKELEVFRGCIVTAEGTLGIPGTGYSSSELYLNVTKITPAPKCLRQPPLPDYSRLRPARWVHNYRVQMDLNYSARGGPITFKITTGGRVLTPWQAYASYWLTGSYVLYGECAKGFVVSRVFGTPEARPAHFDEPGTFEDRAAFDPESAAAKHITKITLGYTCRR